MVILCKHLQYFMFFISLFYSLYFKLPGSSKNWACTCFLKEALKGPTFVLSLKRRRKLYSTHLIGKDALMFGFDLRKLCYWILLLHLYNFLKPLHFRSNEGSLTWLIYTHNMGAIKSRIVHIPFCLSLVCQEKSTILWKAEGKYWKRINGAQHRDGLIVPVGCFYHLYVALH